MGMSASDVPKNHPMPAANGIKGGAKVSLHPNHEQYMRNGRTAASQQTASSTRGAPKPYQQPYLQNPHTGRTEQHSNVISKPPHDAVVSAPPPLFERLHTEEAAEIKTYVRLIESQNRRLLDLERIHSDLERRLELETQRRMALEQRLADQERESELRCRALEKEKIAHQKAVDSEKKKNERLREDMCRKDKEIRKLFYQRKVRSSHNKILSFIKLSNLFFDEPLCPILCMYQTCLIPYSTIQTPNRKYLLLPARQIDHRALALQIHSQVEVVMPLPILILPITRDPSIVVHTSFWPPEDQGMRSVSTTSQRHSMISLGCIKNNFIV